MKTHVEFRSGKFPAYGGEEKEINPGLWGRRLAEFLKEQLATRGLVTGDAIAEDWGYCLPIQREPFDLWIGCGHQCDDEDTFLCFIEPSKPTIRRWFKKIDTTVEVGRVADLLDEVLRADPGIHDLRWLEEGEQ